jgi:hypothetical protein
MYRRAPDNDPVSIFNLIPPNQHLHERRIGLLVRGYMTEAAESLIAQLHSHNKLTTPRRENLKIRHENESLKANEPAPYVYKLQIYRMTQKNIILLR